jgi:BolA protein
MCVQNKIEEKLAQYFEPVFLQVINESGMHNVPEGSETHFKIVVVTEAFEGKRLIGRHREVNKLLKDELENDIHALAMHTYTESEWINIYGEFPASPNCLGGSKHERSNSLLS